MYRWQKELDKLAISWRRVLRLQRSFNRIQVALPGFPSQEATAYLCAFGSARGVRVAAVLHLHLSDRLAIYLNDDGEVADRRAATVLSEGVAFVESMGFMLDDLHFQAMAPEEREALWGSLPLTAVPKGQGQEKPPAAPVRPASPAQRDAAPIEDDEWLPSSLRRRRRPPPEELEERRRALCEGLGRFMASM